MRFIGRLAIALTICILFIIIADDLGMSDFFQGGIVILIHNAIWKSTK